jgi:uncharacterized protein (TIGR03435 family)
MKRTLICAVGVLLVAANVAAALGQTITQAEIPEFDVAAIRLHHPAPHERSHIYSSASDGNFKTINVSLGALLQFAFGIPESRILGDPDGLRSQMFDIEAKADGSVDDRLSKLPSDQGKLVKQQMVQALLADRFKLVAHRETRELPIYALVVAKGGSKLQTSKSNGLMISSGSRNLNAQGVTVAMIAQELAKDVGRVVVDKTGIEGRFDVDLKWTSDEGAVTGDADELPSIFTAVQEQMGLKLEAQKGPVEVLVIDHLEGPSEN